MKEFVLDASFALRWCFEDEATVQTESLLTLLQNQEAVAWVPGIWRYEMLNALGKGISRERLSRSKALMLWQEIQVLPLYTGEVAVDDKLLEFALGHNLAVYDASYLALAQRREIAIATVDGKLQRAAAIVVWMSLSRKLVAHPRRLCWIALGKRLGARNLGPGSPVQSVQHSVTVFGAHALRQVIPSVIHSQHGSTTKS